MVGGPAREASLILSQRRAMGQIPRRPGSGRVLASFVKHAGV
jgi:hypothetical protein